MHAMHRHSISITQLASFSFNLPDLHLKRLAVLCLYIDKQKGLAFLPAIFYVHAKKVAPILAIEYKGTSFSWISSHFSSVFYSILYCSIFL